MLLLFFILSCYLYTGELAHMDCENLRQVKKELHFALDLCWKKSDGFFLVHKRCDGIW